jgi:hypothetical protein
MVTQSGIVTLTSGASTGAFKAIMNIRSTPTMSGA